MLVRVYRNLHRDCWSVVDRRTGRVVQHATEVRMKRCSFVVRPAGRAQVLREKRKTVHAFVCGQIAVVRPDKKITKQVHYNPYYNKTFVLTDGSPVHSAAFVLLDPTGCWALLPSTSIRKNPRRKPRPKKP